MNSRRAPQGSSRWGWARACGAGSNAHPEALLAGVGRGHAARAPVDDERGVVQRDALATRQLVHRVREGAGVLRRVGGEGAPPLLRQRVPARPKRALLRKLCY
eukprot:1188440-Prorocentrum_minimum.AAC.1